jgi:hypothetical protein
MPQRGGGGFQGFHQPQLGAIPTQQRATGTCTMENSSAQTPILRSQSARASRVEGISNGAGQGGAVSMPPIHQPEQGSQPSLSEIGGLSAPTTELLKRLLSTMVGKEKITEDVHALGNMKALEKVNQVMQDKATDIAESWSQGEARGSRRTLSHTATAACPRGTSRLQCVASMQHLFKSNAPQTSLPFAKESK